MTNEAQIKQALKHIQSGEYKAAISELETGLKQSPAQAETHALLSGCYYETKQYNQAQKHVKQALMLDADNPDAHFIQGCLALEKDQFQKALSAFQFTLKAAPKKPEVLFKMAITQAALKDFNSAIQTYQTLLQSNPEFMLAYRNMGFLYTQINQDKKAIQCLMRYTKEIPEDREALFSLGIMLYNLEDYDTALKVFTKSAKTDDPEEKEAALYNLHLCHRALEQREKALDMLNQCLGLNPSHTPYLIEIATLYLEIQDFDQTQATLQKVLKASPKNIDALFLKGFAFILQKEVDKACQAFEALLKVEPEHEKAREYLTELKANPQVLTGMT